MSEVPTLSSDLQRGHSEDCRYLWVNYYNDLKERVYSTLSELRDGLYSVIESDIDFADKADKVLKIEINHRTQYDNLIARASQMQALLNDSKLNDDEKKKIWEPITQCYAEIRTALKERITPIEDRELIEVGSRIDAYLAKVMQPRIQKFQYVVQHYSCGKAPSLFPHDISSSFSFSPSYLMALSNDIKKQISELEGRKIPCKVQSIEQRAGDDYVIYLMIDQEALAQMEV